MGKAGNVEEPTSFTVLATLLPDYTEELIRNAKKLRNHKDDVQTGGETILLSQEWEEQLKEFSQLKSKYLTIHNCRDKGRMLQLLK